MHSHHLITAPAAMPLELSDRIVALHQPHSASAADFRRLAQTLALRWFHDGADEAATLSIISADRQEGRSTVAANLACIFATAGISCLLIDADTHYPSLHTTFGILHDAAPRRSGHMIPGLPNLNLIPAAEMAASRTDEFMAGAVRRLLAELRSEYRVIIVDTPAAAVSNEYQAAALATSGALVVTRENVTRARRTARLLDSCEDANVAVLGGIMMR